MSAIEPRAMPLMAGPVDLDGGCTHELSHWHVRIDHGPDGTAYEGRRFYLDCDFSLARYPFEPPR
eukprot:999969-Rhodomonas_salina.3